MISANKHGRKMKVRRTGRHTTPSQAVKATEMAGKAAPAMAVAGVIMAAPQAPASGSPHAQAAHKTVPGHPVQARLDAAIQPPMARQADRSYTVASGDTLASIARHFYGRASDWRSLYQANQSAVRNPNMIYPGETLKIPGDPPATSGPARTSSAHGSGGYQARHARFSSADTGGSTYANPLRSVSGLRAERIDQGVDYAGTGPLHAIGPGVITNTRSGWPNGVFIVEHLTGGPEAGNYIYYAEDVSPTVSTGQQVNSSSVVGDMFNGGDGIEIGWAAPPPATGDSMAMLHGQGSYPTAFGESMSALLHSLGAPAGLP